MAGQPLINENHDIKVSWCRTKDTQYQHAACLAFVAHFQQRGQVCTSSAQDQPQGIEFIE